MEDAPQPHPERAHPRAPGEHEQEQIDRQAELDAAQAEHNQRTGGASVEEGGVTRQREEHQERT